MTPGRFALAGSITLAVSLGSGPARAEDARCLAREELGLWPAPSLPYVLFAVDTSSGLADPVGAAPSCAGYPSDRLGHLRCALWDRFPTLEGAARVGIATGARSISGCADCFGGCVVDPLPNDAGPVAGCGAEPTPTAPASSSRAGANLVVPIARDDFWEASPTPTNFDALAAWVDGSCDDGSELFAGGTSGANGLLRDALRYFEGGWDDPVGGGTVPSPLGGASLGERSCRKLAVVLVLGGDEGCDDPTDAVNAAGALRAGFAKDGLSWSVRTYVIAFEGVTVATADAIAAAGGTVEASVVADEVGIEAAIEAIVSDLHPSEACDNLDDDCNGCTDEGFAHHCNTNAVCCPNETEEERQGCLDAHAASVLADPPDGDRGLLPCASEVAAWEPARWLCSDPGDDACNGVDDNCNLVVDDEVGAACVPDDRTCPEGVFVCDGDTLRCVGTRPEVCDGEDDDCDGSVDDDACPATEACVDYLGSLFCATACEAGDFPCPAGQKCDVAIDTESGASTSVCVEGEGGCLVDAACASVTVLDEDGDPECGATLSEDYPCHPSFSACVCAVDGFCTAPPCRDADGDPTTCVAPLACAFFGPRAGSCARPDCFHLGCLECGEVCTEDGSCTDSPCQEGSCILPERSVCKPTNEFSSFECVGSCAGVRCPEGQVCARGEPVFLEGDIDCVPVACTGTCGPYETCAPSGGVCIPNACRYLDVDEEGNPFEVQVDCGPPGCCDPLTGRCVPCPCEGVVCPAGQVCVAETGDCVGGRALGQPCEGDSDCGSAHCTDGVCCDGPCEEGCHACSVALKGTGANGTCEPVTLGLADPRGTCDTEPAETCGETGVCDGEGTCARHPAGTACAQNLACDAEGQCRKSRCTSNLDCGGSDVCSGSGDCIPRPVEVTGCAAAPGGRMRSGGFVLAALAFGLGALSRRRASQRRRDPQLRDE